MTGVEVLKRIFGSGDDGRNNEWERQRRITQGRGGSATQTHWTRSERRTKTKAQGIARRVSRKNA